jgi:cation:H+ antiporter
MHGLNRMPLLNSSLSLVLVFPIFFCSLAVVIAASSWFTSRLEVLCEVLGLSVGLLSLLGAVGANIPNYVSSAVAISTGHTDVGIGIIIGSCIYNIAVILGLCALAVPGGKGIVLDLQQRRNMRLIGRSALAITLLSLLALALLPEMPKAPALPHQTLFLFAVSLVALVCFGLLVLHIFKHSHGIDRDETALAHHVSGKRRGVLTLLRLGAEVVLALVISLTGVQVMVSSGQVMTADLHLPPAFAGLVVLAVATSLPNTVVALSLVRTGEGIACIEEIFNSNSINIALGIFLPILFWLGAIADHLLLLVDGPLMVLLTLALMTSVFRGRLSRLSGIALLGVYIAWVILRLKT